MPLTDRPASNEQEPLLKPPPEENSEDDIEPSEVKFPTSIARRLYVSHFLSTWNSRVFEFGAVLYLATIFPGTLMPMSIYAFTRGLSAILFASAVGMYIDTGDRLKVVRTSIVVQRFVVATSCVVFYLLLTQTPFGHGYRKGMLAVVALLACFEKLCSVMNMVSVEKDWVVVVARGNQSVLRTMNAEMRRIDLLCKLLGPLFIALLDGYSTKIAIIVNFGMNVASIPIEYLAIARVYHQVPELQESKTPQHTTTTAADPADDTEDPNQQQSKNSSSLKHNLHHVATIVQKSISDFSLYTHHPAFLPSIAGALLYLTVLNFSGQMVTYLRSIEYTSTEIGVARTVSVAFEVLATWVAPWLISKVGAVRAGLWLSTQQVSMLVAGIVVFWIYTDNDNGNGNSNGNSNESDEQQQRRRLISTGGLVIGTILSRIGLRGFDLSTQLIVQEEVPASQRGAFSSTESATQSLFELLSYTSTILFSAPSQFKYPATISVGAVACASASYTVYVRIRRGHLFHTDVVTRRLESLRGRGKKGKQRDRELVIERITSNRDV